MAQFDPTVLKQLAETMRQSGATDAARASLAEMMRQSGAIDCLARPDWAGVLRGRPPYVHAVAAAGRLNE